MPLCLNLVRPGLNKRTHLISGVSSEYSTAYHPQTAHWAFFVQQLSPDRSIWNRINELDARDDNH